jgi:hypothetical protein
MYPVLDHTLNPHDRLHNILTMDFNAKLKDQYSNVEAMEQQYLETMKNPGLKNDEKLNQLYKLANMTKETVEQPGSLPVAILRNGMVAYHLRDPLLRTMETFLYRRRNMDISEIFVSNPTVYICSSPNNPPYHSEQYPFMDGLCSHLYDRFLNDHDYEKVKRALVRTGKMLYSLSNTNDILWDIIYSLKTFKEKSEYHKVYLTIPGYKKIGCTANTPYFFGLITKEECIQLLTDINVRHGLYGTPLEDIAGTLCPNSKVITIPILGNVELLMMVLNEVVNMLPKKSYTFVKFITRLNTIQFGHTVTLIKLYNCLYLMDMTIGNVSKLNQDILNYYCRIHDGIQIITTQIEGSEQFDTIFDKLEEIYKSLDLELDSISEKFICIEQIKIKNPEVSDVEVVYDSLDIETKKIYVKQYLNDISDKHQKQLREDMGMSGGGKISQYCELPIDLYYLLYTNISYTQIDIVFILYLYGNHVYEYIKELNLIKDPLVNAKLEGTSVLELMNQSIQNPVIKPFKENQTKMIKSTGGKTKKKMKKFKKKFTKNMKKIYKKYEKNLQKI